MYMQLRETERSLGQQLKAMEGSLQLATGEKEEQLRLLETLRVSVGGMYTVCDISARTQWTSTGVHVRWDRVSGKSLLFKESIRVSVQGGGHVILVQELSELQG